MDALGAGPLSRKTLWVVAGKFIQFLAWLIALAVLARRLDPAEFGLFQQGWLLIGTLTPILLLGLPQGINSLLPRLHSNELRQTGWMSLLLVFGAAIPTAAVFAAMPRVASAVIGELGIRPLVPVIMLVMLANLPSYFFEPIAILRNRPRTLLAFQTIYWIAFAVIAVSFGRRSQLHLLFAALAGLGLARALATFIFVSGQIGKPVIESSKPLRPLLQMAKYLAPVELVGVLSVQIDKYIVSHWMAADGYAIYSIGAIEVPFVPLLLAAVTATLLPELSRQLAAKNRPLALEILDNSMVKLGWILLPLFGYLMFFSHMWLPLVFGERYVRAVPVFLVFLTLIPLRALNLHPLFLAAGMQRYLLRGRLLDLGLNFVACLVLIRSPLGMLGPAVATVAATVAHKVYQTLVIMRELQVPPAKVYPAKALFQCLLISLAAGFGGWLCSAIGETIIAGLLAGTICFAIIMAAAVFVNFTRQMRQK